MSVKIANHILQTFGPLLVLGLSHVVPGQATPTATRAIQGQAGGSYINGYADYTISRFNGYGFYGDVDFRHGLGVEAEYHHIGDLDPNYLIAESSYEIGARYSRRYRRLQPYAKILVGRGTFDFLQSSNAYTLYGLGFGADVRVYRSINVRVEDEFQKWLPGSGAGAAALPNGLSPNLPAVGIAYRFR